MIRLTVHRNRKLVTGIDRNEGEYAILMNNNRINDTLTYGNILFDSPCSICHSPGRNYIWKLIEEELTIYGLTGVKLYVSNVTDLIKEVYHTTEGVLALGPEKLSIFLHDPVHSSLRINTSGISIYHRTKLIFGDICEYTRTDEDIDIDIPDIDNIFKLLIEFGNVQLKRYGSITNGVCAYCTHNIKIISMHS